MLCIVLYALLGKVSDTMAKWIGEEMAAMASAFRKNGRKSGVRLIGAPEPGDLAADPPERGWPALPRTGECPCGLHHVTKRFGNGPAVLKDVHLSVRGRGVRGCRRPQRLRQKHAAAIDRRTRKHRAAGHRWNGAVGPSAGTDPAVRVMFQDARLLPWRDGVRERHDGRSGTAPP